jgi:hypothetical protein
MATRGGCGDGGEKQRSGKKMVVVWVAAEDAGAAALEQRASGSNLSFEVELSCDMNRT